MIRVLTCREGAMASGGDVFGRARRRAFRGVLGVLLCGAMVLWALSAQGLAAGRKTKDTAAAASSSTRINDDGATTRSNGEASASTKINGTNPVPSKPVSPSLSLGATPVRSPANFQECVRVTLAQSPLLTKSSIEIESRRLDVGDAYSQYIPTMNVTTTFYLRLPEYKSTYTGSDDRKRYDLSFSTGTWNPLVTVFDVQAKKEIVNIAVLSHLKVIDGGLKRLGSVFLKLGMVESMLQLAREKEDLAVKNLEYVKTKVGLGQGAMLDVRIAETRINVVKAEAERLRSNKAALVDELKFIMGLPVEQKVNFSLADAPHQVLDDFNPASVTVEKLRKHSFTLRIHSYEKELQKKNIALSYVRFMPSISFGFTSVSTLNSADYKSDSSIFPFMYPNISLNMPFDWWTKGRDVSRQYKKLAQLNVEGRNLEFTLLNQFQQALSGLRAANSDVKLAESNLELQKLVAQQAQFRFDSGQVEYDALVKAMSEYLKTKQEYITKQYQRDSALLEVRSVSGEFQDRYINASVMESI